MAGQTIKDVPEGLEKGLRNYWYPLLSSGDLSRNRPVAIEALGEKLVAWRDRAGQPHLVRDACPHRLAKLSDGLILNGDIQCIFHGLRFNGEGRCTLIPWEPEDSPLLGRISVVSYPIEELGGYLWAYIGDASAFPPPPLKDEVPAELLDEDQYLTFRLPLEIWNANWLFVIDGTDGYHAATLHANSQGVTDDKWTGGRAQESRVPLEDRRLMLANTPQGLRGVPVDRQGNRIHTGHFLREIFVPRLILPGIATNPIRPAPGAIPYVARMWASAVDANRTRIVRYATWRVTSDADRKHIEKIYQELALPRMQRVSDEDARMVVSQGDLAEARATEFLLAPDINIINMRRQLKGAFLAQQDGKRVAVPGEALVYPLEIEKLTEGVA